MPGLLLWLIARIVPSPARERWLEEWQAEFRHGRWAILAGALPDAMAVRRLARTSPSWRGPLRSDTRQTLRSLRRAPWHVVTVTLCLGIGIAVTVTVFSILSSILTGDLPGVRDRSTLMRLSIENDEPDGRRFPYNASVEEFDVLRQGAPNMPSVGAEGSWQFAVRTAAGASLVRGAFVSGNYFEVLGTVPALGRLLVSADDDANAPMAVVVSHAFWSAQLGARPDVVGSTIAVGGIDALIVGVAPQYFSGMDVGDLGEPPGLRYRIFVPLAHSANLAQPIARDGRWLRVLGRAGDRRQQDTLAAEFEPLARRIEDADPLDRKNAGIVVHPASMGPRETFAVVAILILLLMAAPLTVLAIACANVANLQLVRATLRARELAVRSALGASRGQLVRLLTVESAALAMSAVAAGGLGTYLLLRVAALVVPFHVTIDWPVLVFVVAIAALVVVVTGIIPGWLTTRPEESLALAGSQRTSGGPVSRLRRSLVIAQVALSLLLLLTASVFTRSLGILAGRIPDTAREAVVAEVRFDALGYDGAGRTAFVSQLQARLAADGRVDSFGVSSVAPLRRGGRRFWLPGDADDRLRDAGASQVSAGWFRAAGLTTVRGRTFTESDIKLGHVVVVDEAFVRRHRLEEPVIGTVLRVDSVPTVRSAVQSINDESHHRIDTATIVGVVSNALTRPLIPDPQPNMYLPLQEVPDYVSVYVRSTSPLDMHSQVRRTMASIDPDLPASQIATLAQRFDDDAGDVRLLASAASGLGLSALVLALAGVYSVVAFFVSLRTHEFGIRLAIGARPYDIVRMVVLQSTRLVAAGSIVGLVIGTPVLIFLSKAFPYTSAFDPVGLAIPLAGLVTTAVAAATLPARRAARVDPCSALRSE